MLNRQWYVRLRARASEVIMDAATRAHLLRQLGREREVASEPEPEPAPPPGKPAGVKVVPRQRQKRARPQPVTVTLPSFGEASAMPKPGVSPAQTTLRAVHERAMAALAQLEGLTVAAPRFATSSQRRRHHQAAHALEAARVALRRAVMLAGQEQSAD